MQLNPFMGAYGGQFVGTLLLPALDALEKAFVDAMNDPTFNAELQTLLTTYAGRPTPLTRVQNLTRGTRTRLYLKREDLLHGGAHKTNQVLAQALLAKRMGKTRIVAETGAGQHGTATAMACALMGFECVIYMGAKDVARQAANVYRMELMGATVVAVEAGDASLKDACEAALMDYAMHLDTTHYLLGTAAGPHPYPTLVQAFQKVIGEEALTQIQAVEPDLPDAVIAACGGGSNAIGLFTAFIPHTSVAIIGVEPAGRGLHTQEHGAPLCQGTPGVFFGMRSYCMQDQDGEIGASYSIAAGLDFPGIGPAHAYLKDTGRAHYVGITDKEAFDAFLALSRQEGIIPAFESSHALAHALKMARTNPDREQVLIVNLSGRGDKDVMQAKALMPTLAPEYATTQSETH